MVLMLKKERKGWQENDGKDAGYSIVIKKIIILFYIYIGFD